MKRYKIQAKADGGYLREADDGNYYLVSDVEAQMVPRPDPVEARKVVDKFETALERLHGPILHGRTIIEQREQAVEKARSDLLKLVGVEVKP